MGRVNLSAIKFHTAPCREISAVDTGLHVYRLSRNWFIDLLYNMMEVDVKFTKNCDVLNVFIIN